MKIPFFCVATLSLICWPLVIGCCQANAHPTVPATAPADALDEIQAGYLIVGEQIMTPPFIVKLDGNAIRVNGTQVYPAVLSDIERKRVVARKAAKERRDVFHEDYYREKQHFGEEKALQNLEERLRTAYGPKRYALKRTQRGMTVELPGDDGPTYLILSDDQAPSQREKMKNVEDSIWKKYVDWRTKLGKNRALDLIERELAQEPMVAEFSLSRERERVTLRWKGRREHTEMGLWPEGHKGNVLPTKEEAAHKRLRNTVNEIARLLRKDRCVVILRGNIYSSLNGKAACDAVKKLAAGGVSEEAAMAILSEHFSGSENYIWEDFQRNLDVR